MACSCLAYHNLLLHPDSTPVNTFLQAIGNYHSTKIWSFRMTTPCCQNKIEIHTDPKNARYIIVEGAKQKVCLTVWFLY